MRSSIAQQLFQLFPRRAFAWVRFVLRDKVPFNEIEIFAEISHVLFLHRFRTAIPALVRDARIVTGAIQADPQICAATMARFASSGLAADRPFPTAFVTMSRHKI